MNVLVKDLTERAIAFGFDDTAAVVATAAVPYLRAALVPPTAPATAVIDPAILRAVIARAASLLGGTTPEPAVAMSPYTAEEMATMADRTAALARNVLASYALDVVAADAERLLGAVADRVLAAVPAV